MSAQPQNPNAAPDLVNVEIDGKALKVAKGSMIIQAADAAGIAIPRFCYHDKLPIAANCRMCLVDVEKAPKPMPACASPVTEGMKVYTQSKRALDAQRNVMEFLLINHPLDCPVCDQGGECELQDLSIGYGRSVSRFVERKRVVADEDLGPLISTEMTRCIHCTRCVRFVAEIAGTHELGGLNRGEQLEIGTYIGKSIESELSGNVIDVCPVGALTNKVFRFRARAWELAARESVGYHDALGSNLWLHVRRGEVLRAVPRDNDAINECWLADRDRYSHEALESADRLAQPQLKRADGQWRAATWDEAIAAVGNGLRQAVDQHGGEQLGALVAPWSTLEEGHLAARLLRGLGSENIDHRLRVLDFADAPVAQPFSLPLAAIERAGAIVLVGSNPRHDAPLLGHRVRKAWKNGAAVYAVNPVRYPFHFETRHEFIAGAWGMAGALAALARAAAGERAPPAGIADLVAAADADSEARGAIDALRQATDAVLVFGDFAVQHPAASVLRALARFIAAATGCHYNELPAGANAVGLARAGALPAGNGLHAGAMLARPRKSLLLHHVEGPIDFADGTAAAGALRQSQFTVALSAFDSTALRQYAHAILPVALPPEGEGSYANVDGTLQAVVAAAKAPGEARPAWRVLRALGGALDLPGFDFTEFAALRAAATAGAAPASGSGLSRRDAPTGMTRIATLPMFRVDPVVRRAAALQATVHALPARVVLHPGDALALGLGAGARAIVSDGSLELALPVETSMAVPHGGAWIEAGHAETALLAPSGAPLTVRKA